MNSFKKYLEEEPIFITPKNITCPFVGHKGEPINGSNVKFQYDVLRELFPKPYQLKLFQAHHFFKPTGTVPLLCLYDMKIFMWNVDTNETFPPTTSEDLKFCEIYKTVMTSEKSRDRNSGPFENRFNEISILNVDET